MQRFQEELQKRLRGLQEQTLKAAGAVASLQNQRRELKGQAQNLGEAIAKMGHSATLFQQLAGIESEIERIDERLALANQPLDLAFSLELIRDFVSQKALDFTGHSTRSQEKCDGFWRTILKSLSSHREKQKMALFMTFPGISIYLRGSDCYGPCGQGHPGPFRGGRRV